MDDRVRLSITFWEGLDCSISQYDNERSETRIEGGGRRSEVHVGSIGAYSAEV